MGKADRLKAVPEQELPAGTYKLTRMQVAAISDTQRAATELLARRKDWAEWEHKMLIPAEKQVAERTQEVFDELCDAHGIERNSREIIVSKDLTTFTLGATNGETEGQQEQTETRASGIVDARGNAIGATTGLKLAASLTPGEPGEPITAEGAGQLLHAIGADRD